jgi:GlpG protein
VTVTREPRTALELPLDVDISALSAALYRSRVPHRIYERQGRQVVEVLNGEDVPVVQAAYRAWSAQAGSRPRPPAFELRGGAAGLMAACRRTPGVAAIVVLAVLLFPVGATMQVDSLGAALRLLTIVPLENTANGFVSGRLADVFTTGQLWRLVSPAWLHFSFAHLAFNLALIVYFGRRIERGAGTLVLLTSVAIIAAVSNVSQFLASGSPLFGGLSGVAYGLFGFVVVRGRQRPHEDVWHLPIAFVVAMLVSLAVMASGITEPFGLAIANVAHVGGLLCGGGCALALGFGGKKPA